MADQVTLVTNWRGTRQTSNL